MASEPKQRLTIQDYLAIERDAEMKSEYLDGEMFAMTGASHAHNVIVTNAVAALRPQLRSRGCTLYANDMRVRTPTDLCTYPDVAVVCGERTFDDPRRDTILNPMVVLEVLSESTQDYDRGTKFSHYRTIPSLTDVVLIQQDRPHVEHFMRQASDRWLLLEIDSLESTLELTSIGCVLPLADLYEDILSAP
jgi:Uma2 family endonuclease